MKRTGLIITAVVVGVIAILGIFLASSYNSLVRTEEDVTLAYSNVDTTLTRRADLIPNLVNTVKGYNIQEQEVIDSVTNARAKMAGASTAEEKFAADSELDGALSRLLVVVENYPELKSNTLFVSLMDELAGTENRISIARQDYNQAVATYNRKIKTFPSSMIAGMFGFDAKPYFEATEEEKQNPTVSFPAAT